MAGDEGLGTNTSLASALAATREATPHTDAPLVSVVIPVRDRTRELKAAVVSALAQDIQDLEVVVVDDGSDVDIKGALLALSSEPDPRVRYVRQSSAGGNVARNRGVQESRGRWVAFLDSDDAFVDGHLRRAVDALQSEPYSFYCAPVRVDRGGGRSVRKPPRRQGAKETLANYLLCSSGFVPASTLVLSREAAGRIRWDDDLPCSQDTDYALRLDAAGLQMVMGTEVGAQIADVDPEGRVSSLTHVEARRRWIDSMRSTVGEKAYWGYRGWILAKAQGQEGRRVGGLANYVQAAMRGAYSPKMALFVGLQVVFPNGGYRRLVDTYLRLTG